MSDSLEIEVTPNESLELEVNPPYIGSAYSPTVDITETDDEITVTITDKNGEHSYTVPNADGAISDAEAATAAANTAAANANDAASAANTAKNNANSAASAANSAASAAASAAEQAVDKAEIASGAASDALEAASLANYQAGQAEDAADTANTAASVANAKIVEMESAIESADDATRAASAAADDANEAASSANAAATSAAEATETVDEAVSNANSAASNANTKAGLAAEAASSATTAASAANSAATSATSAASNANTKASAADTAATAANSAATSANSAATSATSAATAANEAAEAANTAAEYASEFVEAYMPAATVGASDNLTPRETSEQTFMFRASNAEDDTVAGIEVVKGNTVVWNQLINPAPVGTQVKNGVSFTVGSDGTVTASGTATEDAFLGVVLGAIGGHKYLTRSVPPGGSASTYLSYMTGAGIVYNDKSRDIGNGAIAEPTQDGNVTFLYCNVKNGTTVNNIVCRPQVFDLTKMFGAGNEPSTVAEFEALFPDSYYAYDAGSLLNVEMVGVEGVGFNQWDEDWEGGSIDTTTGANIASNNTIRSKNYTPVISGAQYYFLCRLNGVLYWYDSAKSYIGFASQNPNSGFTAPSNAKYMRFRLTSDYGAVYRYDICINLSDPLRNGEYEPYMGQTREIPASTYFPDGMRGAGTAHDALYRDHADTVIGAVDLGTLSYSINTAGVMYTDDLIVPAKHPQYAYNIANLKCASFDTVSNEDFQANRDNKTMAMNVSGRTYFEDSDHTTPSDFKAAMNGVMLFYELATPTAVEINPPLNLTFKSYEGGTERVLVDTTQTAPQSAPPRLLMGYGDTAKTIRDKALSVIAMVEKSKAKANHAANTYLILNGKLYKVTSAIATGESITPGTNVTETTVMAELLARL